MVARECSIETPEGVGGYRVHGSTPGKTRGASLGSRLAAAAAMANTEWPEGRGEVGLLKFVRYAGIAADGESATKDLFWSSGVRTFQILCATEAADIQATDEVPVPFIKAVLRAAAKFEGARARLGGR